VSRDITYQEFQVQLKPGDAIILFSDGVTECRVDGQFLGRKRFKEIILKYLDRPAQEAVELIYQHIYELAKYKLKDDQTILLIRPKPLSDG
jgi:sigma-B regulation protein RsbU (phosphoserine phosphatase)